MRKINSIIDVVDWGLCVGCGACQFFCGDEAISLENIANKGIRPKFKKKNDPLYLECLQFCPGYFIDSRLNSQNRMTFSENNLLIGPTIEIWEGFAKDPEIRYRASSGGILSAVAAYCLERENMGLVLHVGMDHAKPWNNQTVQSRNRNDLLARTGSRYAPSSPCEGLRLIEKCEQPCVFIGKPCDVAAVSALRKLRPELNSKLGLVLTFFCAGPPCTDGTMSLLRHLDVNPKDVNEIRYRGNGWPGNFTVTYDDRSKNKSLTYQESWGNLVKHPRSFRCHLCPDGLGELADISCGDAWHLYDDSGNAGRSLVLARTIQGKDILRCAAAAGYVDLTQSQPSEVIKAQPLTQRRAVVFGRMMAMKVLGIPVPEFLNFHLRETWLAIPTSLKIKTLLGTIKRILIRGLWHRNPPHRSDA